jgi:tripartite-type tricarboxylate transporter receptor subunit TctC
LFAVFYPACLFDMQTRLNVIPGPRPKGGPRDPDIPLIAETVPGFSALSFIGVIAPAGVPKPVLRQISSDVGRTVKSAVLTERMTKLGMEPVGSSSDEYDALIRNEIDKWTRVVKTAGIKVN